MSIRSCITGKSLPGSRLKLLGSSLRTSRRSASLQTSLWKSVLGESKIADCITSVMHHVVSSITSLARWRGLPMTITDVIGLDGHSGDKESLFLIHVRLESFIPRHIVYASGFHDRIRDITMSLDGTVYTWSSATSGDCLSLHSTSGNSLSTFPLRPTLLHRRGAGGRCRQRGPPLSRPALGLLS